LGSFLGEGKIAVHSHGLTRLGELSSTGIAVTNFEGKPIVSIPPLVNKLPILALLPSYRGVPPSCSVFHRIRIPGKAISKSGKNLFACIIRCNTSSSPTI